MTLSNAPRIIAGFGRSGTTWVQDVIAQSNSLRTVFEPLHPYATGRAPQHAHTFLNKDDTDEFLFDVLHRYFYEEFRSIWVDYRVPHRWLYPRWEDLASLDAIKKRLMRIDQSRAYFFRYNAQRKHEHRIVKLVRANMILSWLKAKFDARIVYIIRHPAAVVKSQSKSLSSWDPYERIEAYRANPRLLALLDDATRALLQQPLEDIEALTLCWCIENIVALMQARESNILVIHYEELLERGDTEWRQILSALELQNMPDRDLIYRPSQQAEGDKARDSALVRKYGSWMNALDTQTAARIQGILDATGMNTYHVDQARPLAKA